MARNNVSSNMCGKKRVDNTKSFFRFKESNGKETRLAALEGGGAAGPEISNRQLGVVVLHYAQMLQWSFLKLLLQCSPVTGLAAEQHRH